MNYLRKTAATARPNSELRKASDILHVDGMYLVSLSNGKGTSFKGYTPADLSFSISSAWTAPYAEMDLLQGAADRFTTGRAAAVANSAIKASRKIGVTQFYHALSGKQWTEPQWLNIDLPIFLHAQGNAKDDVTRKALEALKAVSPTSVGGMLLAPGPIPAVEIAMDAVNSVMGVVPNYVSTDGLSLPSQMDEAFTLSIGNFFLMPKCIVTNINTKFDGRFQEGNGHPISADLMMTVESYFAVTKQDLDSWFKF